MTAALPLCSYEFLHLSIHSIHVKDKKKMVRLHWITHRCRWMLHCFTRRSISNNVEQKSADRNPYKTKSMKNYHWLLSASVVVKFHILLLFGMCILCHVVFEYDSDWEKTLYVRAASPLPVAKIFSPSSSFTLFF